MTQRHWRQGDVLISHVPTMPTDATPLPRTADARIVLAHGEVTGHAHAIADPDVQLYVTPGATAEAADRWLRVGAAGATVQHEEHAALMLPPGIYRIRRQREYSPAALRIVAD